MSLSSTEADKFRKYANENNLICEKITLKSNFVDFLNYAKIILHTHKQSYVHKN